MRFLLINKETIVTKTNCLVLRIMAVTDKKAFNHCKMLNIKPVKLQRQVGKNKFETFAEADNIHCAGSILDEYINTFTYGQKYVRL